MSFQPRYSNLVELLQASVTEHGSRPLFGTKKAGQWVWMTYRDFGRMVDQCRAGLAAYGIERGDRVAVISNNRLEWAVGAYATYGLGAAYVPMYEAQQEREWKFILQDSCAKVVFAATTDIARRLRNMQGELARPVKIVCFEGTEEDADSFDVLLEAGRAAPTASAIPEPSAIADIIYTSGTTGNPKGVLLSHANLALNALANLEAFGIGRDDRTLSFLPWAHIFGQTAELHTLIGAGASAGIAEGIPKIVDNLAEVKPTILVAVPNIFIRIFDGVRKQMAQKPKLIRRLFHGALTTHGKVSRGEAVSFGERLGLAVARRVIFAKVVRKFGGRLRCAVSGGSALPKEVGEFVDALGICVFEGYGLTETSPVATVNTPQARRLGSVGKPIPGVTVKLDVSGNNDEGEIVVYGHNVMAGYHNLPDETARVSTGDGGFRTGDLGRFDSDGFLYITGRIKELYKLDNGKYVAPAALEAKLVLMPHIAQAMVYGANKSHNVAILVPNFASLTAWASQQGLGALDNEALVRHPKVRALLRAEVDQASEGWKGFERIKDFVIAHEEFSVANDLLTPKLSLKRRNIIRRYGPELDALYSRDSATVAA